jgi:hypothetical protein
MPHVEIVALVGIGERGGDEDAVEGLLGRDGDVIGGEGDVEEGEELLLQLLD